MSARFNTSRSAARRNLLHGDEERVWGDAGYTGIEKREEHQARDVTWLVALRPGKRAQLPPTSRLARTEKLKASVRAKGEHPFRYIKRVFGYDKVRYRGLAKNEETRTKSIVKGETICIVAITTHNSLRKLRSSDLP